MEIKNCNVVSCIQVNHFLAFRYSHKIWSHREKKKSMPQFILVTLRCLKENCNIRLWQDLFTGDHKNNHNFWKESNETMEGFANKHVLQCNYTSHKQSDLCKQLHHTVKQYKANKRFFRCKQCHRRTVSYERLPTAPCTVNFFGSRGLGNYLVQINGQIY